MLAISGELDLNASVSTSVVNRPTEADKLAIELYKLQKLNQDVQLIYVHLQLQLN